jgi:hypothetical protein
MIRWGVRTHGVKVRSFGPRGEGCGAPTASAVLYEDPSHG